MIGKHLPDQDTSLTKYFRGEIRTDIISTVVLGVRLSRELIRQITY